MCNNCDKKEYVPIFDLEAKMDEHQKRLDGLLELNRYIKKLTSKDQEFASSLTASFMGNGGLSQKQWYWVDQLVDRTVDAEPIYGDFNAIHVMFQMAGEHLKYPKIRLLSAEDTFVQLNFRPDTKDLTIYRDGWQGHGYRKFVGWIKDNTIVPFRSDRMSDDVRLVIQEFALDPAGVAKAMSLKLGACLYCGSRLSTDESKSRGYGPTCADRYGLPWGKPKKEVKHDPSGTTAEA